MNIEQNVKLAPYTSFKIGGSSKYYAEAKTANEVQEALEFALAKNVSYFVLGSGTNILIRDQGFDGLVIRNLSKGKEMNGGLVVAETGNTLVEINMFANNNELVGFETLATVPGTFGGAIYNNAHYLKSLLSDFLEWVEVLETKDRKVIKRKLNKEDLQLSYDNSLIKKENLIATRAALKLQKGDVKLARQTFIDLVKKRSDLQPYGTFNSGCMFQNVQQNLGPGFNGTSAGYLIQQCGLKGMRVGDAEVSEKHGNFFINLGKASSEDILKLVELCKSKVKEKYNVELELEIKII